MSGDDGNEHDPYRSLSFEELATHPTVYRDGIFDGQVVLITGGGGAIGTAMAVLFGRLGASIVACGRTATSLDTLAERLDGIGVACTTVPMTIRDPADVADLVAAAHDANGRVDHVINNAGGQFAAPSLDISPKGWAAVVETNLYGTWFVMQEAARRWIADGTAGNIVNVSTIQGRASVGIAHTAAARAGGVALTRSLAVEWAPHRIRVNAIAVGVIASEGLRNYPPEARASFGHNPMRHLGDVWDIAEAAVYLAAPSGKFVTGTLLEVTGGEHVWGEYWPLGKPEWFRMPELDEGDRDG